MQVIKLGANMKEIVTHDWRILVSYQTPVAALNVLGARKTSRKWSVTTSKHITTWFMSHGINGNEALQLPQDWFDGLLEHSKYL